ncbi:hypothetical protein ACHMW5_02380 [Azospirillum melinis]|uniref:hypothetical protein n=1 Tax=Azospirillum melinis TaxID=328839 RepID=UPI00375849D2
MAINATSSPCLRCGIGPGRAHIDGCPLDTLLEAVTPRTGGPVPLLPAVDGSPTGCVSHSTTSTEGKAR